MRLKSELSKTTDIFYERHLIPSGVLNICRINIFFSRPLICKSPATTILNAKK